jgi:hypothetical protein
MAYSDFKISELAEKFSLNNRKVRLFGEITPVSEISDWLKKSLQVAEELSPKSEKAKSELIVMPILIELRNQNDKFLTIYSGDNLNVDEEKGLKGECDFILAKDVQSYDINYPIMQIVEAKKGEIEVGVPQCAAQMLGAKIFNQQKGVNLRAIYGCVTTGDDWLFIKLTDEILIDTHKYYLGNVKELLGVFQKIVDEFKAELSD